MKKQTAQSRRAVIKATLNELGRGPRKPHGNPRPDDAPLDVEDVELDVTEYRSGWRAGTGPRASELVRLHPVALRELTTAVLSAQRLSSDDVRDLATAIAASLKFHPDTVRELAKAVALQLELLPDTIGKLAVAIYGHLEKNMAALVEQNAKQADGKVECSICAEGDHRHIHPFEDMTTEDVCAFMGWKRSAIYGRTKRGLMPPPVSAVTPHTYDPHCIALLKEHGLVFPQARYDRAVHLALLPTVEAERAKKKRAFHKRQSEMMARENKRRAATRSTSTDPTSPTKGNAKPKSTVRRETPKKKR
jgi:hypothetical protein